MRILVFIKAHRSGRVDAARATTKLGRRNYASVYQVNNVPDGLTVEEALEQVAKMPLPEDRYQFDWPQEP